MRLAIVVSERAHNVISCISAPLIKADFTKVVVLYAGSPKLYPINRGSAEINEIVTPTAIASRLIDLAAYNPVIIFCDNAISLSTEIAIAAILNNYYLFASCKLIRYSFLPPLSDKRSHTDYLFNGVGKRSLLGLSKRLFHIIQRKTLGTAYMFASYPDDPCTYICPDYGRLNIARASSELIPINKPDPIHQIEICFLYGNESMKVLSSDLFLSMLKLMCSHFLTSIKPHPRATLKHLEYLRTVEKEISHPCIRDSSYWVGRSSLIGVAISSSALFTLDFKHRISISALFADLAQSCTENRVSPVTYHKQLCQFSCISDIFFPGSLGELDSILTSIH